MATPVVSQFGFATSTGALEDMVDGDAGTGWGPVSDFLEDYDSPFLRESSDPVIPSVLAPNHTGVFPAIQFDFGAPVRIGMFLLQTESIATVGPAILVASNNPASSTANTIQNGDVNMGVFTQEELNGQAILETNALDNDVKRRYWRFCFRVTPDPEAS